MFRTVPLLVISSFSLYTQQWCISYRFADSLLAGSGRNCSSILILLALLCLPWETPDDGRRNCPKHVKFYSKNKFEKFVHLVGFIIRIYHDGGSAERQNLKFYSFLNCVLFGRNVYIISITMWTRRGDPLVYPCLQCLAFIGKLKKMEFRNRILRLNNFFL